MPIIRVLSIITLLLFVPSVPLRAAVPACASGDRLDPQAKEALDFNGLENLIRDKKLASPDELLEFFGKDARYRHLLENAVLSPHSEALHRAQVSPEFPRIVLKSNRLILQLIGDPKASSYPVMEVMEYVPAERRFRFHLVNFAMAGRPEQFLRGAERIDERTLPKHPSFDGMVPCASCHSSHGVGEEVRPRFNTPPIFRKPFGRVDNRIIAGSAEMKEWETFQKTLADPISGKRYRLLKEVKTRKLPNGDLEFPTKPNDALANHLGRMNVQRVARLIDSGKRYPREQYALVAAFFDCAGLEAFIPEAERKQRAESLLADKALKLVRDPQRSLIDQLGDRAGRQARDYYEDLFKLDGPFSFKGFRRGGIDFSKLSPKETASKLAELRQGEQALIGRLAYFLDGNGAANASSETTAWSHATTAGMDTALFENDGLGLMDVLRCGLAARFFRDNPELKRDFGGGVLHPAALNIPKADFCAKLKERSLKAYRTEESDLTPHAPKDGAH